MIAIETYTQNNVNPAVHDAVTLYSTRELTEEELFYINEHGFDNASAYGNELYEAYTTFCNEHGERTLPMSSVIPMIASKAGVMKKRTKRGNVYCGLRIKDEYERAG